MDGTRVARVSAVSAAFLLGLALAATTLLETAPAGALHGGAGTAALTDRSPVLLRSVERGAGGSVDGVPRTTPPPTLPAPSPTGTPAAAETVDAVRQT